MIELAKFFLDQHRQLMRLADELGGLARTPEIAGLNGVDFVVAEERGDLLGLTNAGFAEMAIGRSLAAALQIPVGRAVAHEDDLHSQILGSERLI